MVLVVNVLKMSFRDGKVSMLMKTVLVTENIPIESCDIDVGNYLHLKDSSFSNSGSVDILIRQHKPAALVPLKVRNGPKGTPFSIHTIMRWALNGTSAPSTLYHIKLHVINCFGKSKKKGF